jgi:predicted CopG family antitoxin
MHIQMHRFISLAPDGHSVRGKNVALSREAIGMLDREKRPGESYSDVVLRLARQPRPLSALVDALEALGPEPDDALGDRIREMRARERRQIPRRPHP